MKRSLTLLTLLTLVVSPVVFAAEDTVPAVDASPAIAAPSAEISPPSESEVTLASALGNDFTALDFSLADDRRVDASSCSASFDCGDGNTASCTGSTCAAFTHAVPAFVKCDGNKYYCPNMCFVDVRCTATGTIFCSSNVGNCQEGSNWVRCDGNTINCPQFPF
ncbi:MAG: hypothetical protein AAF657_28460 [Acidobacteriota bacterium]